MTTPNTASIAAALPAVPTPHTAEVVVPALTSTSTPAQHASRWHTILSLLEGMMGIAASPAVMALLPSKYQGYIGAAAAVGSVVEEIATSGQPSVQEVMAG